MLNAILIIVLFLVSTLVPNDIVVLLIPVITWLATALVNWFKGWISNTNFGFSGSVLVLVIVPILSALSAWIIELLANPKLSFWVLVLIGLLGNFINEAVKQLKQSSDKTQTKASTKLIG